MRSRPIAPLQRETNGLRIEQRPTQSIQHPRSLNIWLGPTTLTDREFIVVGAIITRPCIITTMTLHPNQHQIANIWTDVLISHDTLTDLDAQLRDRRLSEQRGRRRGFTTSTRGPTYTFSQYYSDIPIVIKGYFYAPLLIGATMMIALKLDIA